MIARLGAVTVVLMTVTAGPRYTHIPLGAEAGLIEYAESYANATDLHTIPKPRLHRRRGWVAGAEMASLERAVRAYLRPATRGSDDLSSRGDNAGERVQTLRTRAPREEGGAPPSFSALLVLGEWDSRSTCLGA